MIHSKSAVTDDVAQGDICQTLSHLILTNVSVKDILFITYESSVFVLLLLLNIVLNFQEYSSQ